MKNFVKNKEQKNSNKIKTTIATIFACLIISSPSFGSTPHSFQPKDPTPANQFPEDLSRPATFNSSNNLIRKTGSFYFAQGEVLRLKGKVQDVFGVPISGATISIWQANSAGKYHTLLEKDSPYIDTHFSMSGRAVTNNLGQYEFITIIPGFYDERAPHINYRIWHEDFGELESEIYFKDHPKNATDPKLKLYSEKDQKRLIADVRPRKLNKPTGDKIATFNITMEGIHAYKEF